ncbi:MAG: tetratricopeptide repeat protein, partial [Rudaea sp.]
MTDFLQRLRERKLVQWALAYVAAAFALIQVVDIVAQRFGWPDSIERILIIATCVGFFVVLVLAWYHGEHGAQKVSGTELAILALLLAIGGGFLWRFQATVPVAALPGKAADTAPVTPPAPSKTAPDKSIAVLPFENLSSDKNNEYFASGMQDMVLTKLADIGELKVISRTSTEKYKSHPDNLKQIAQELGVRNILEGSVQKAGNQVLINVQLIDAATDEHIWAQAYTKTLDNIFGVEGQVAQMVADALKAKLSPAEAQKLAKVGTRNKDAYDLYLRAGYFIDTANRSGDRENLKRSIELLQKAIALDAKYADAYALLALDYAKLGGHADEQEAAARRALALDPGNARAQAEMAFVLSFRGDSAGALEHMREAVRLEPAKATVNYALGFILSEDGRVEEAAAAFAHAAALDPAPNFFRLGVAGTAISRRRYSEAIDALRVSVARDPQDMLS